MQPAPRPGTDESVVLRRGVQMPKRTGELTACGVTNACRMGLTGGRACLLCWQTHGGRVAPQERHPAQYAWKMGMIISNMIINNQ